MMSIINQPITKYKYEGIGETGAAMIVAALASNPSTAFLVAGFWGKAVWFMAKLLVMGLSSIGVVTLNVGVAKIQTILDEGNFDGTWESAQKIIADIHKQGRELTREEAEAIDAPIRDAFRKFGRFGRVRKR